MRIRTYLLSFLIVAGFFAGYILFRPSPLVSQSAPPPGNLTQFRIIIGLKDTEAKEWKGRLTVSGAEIATMQGWRFSQQDRANQDGTFTFRTKVGPLEDQLSKAQPYGQTDWNDPRVRRLIPEGIIVQLRGAEPARAKFESEAGTFDFSTDKVPYGAGLPVLDGNGLVERLPVEYQLSEAGKLDDYPAIATGPDGTRWVAWLSYKSAADQIMVSGGGKIHELTERGDYHVPALASDGQGTIHAVWPRKDGDVFHLYTSRFRGGSWSKAEKLTAAGGSNLWPALASGGNGKVALAWQAFRNNQAVILASLWNGKSWSKETLVSEGPANSWAPSVAYGGGKLWIAWDNYETGSYQIYAREWGGAVQRITQGENFCVRASVAVMASGQPVVAWEESDAAWGKDFAFLTDRKGTVLYKNRRIGVAFREGSEWKAVRAEVAGSLPAHVRRFVQQPQLSVDSSGRLGLLFRVRTSVGNARIDYWASGGRWEVFFTALDGDRWAPASPMPSSVGRNSMRGALALYKGQAHIVWPTDRRQWPVVKQGDLDVMATTVPVSAGPARLANGAPIVAPAAIGQNAHPNEREDTKRARAYRINIGGKQYRILRGDLHRHTELSGDGAGDGSLDDLYRYTLDAAAMDYGHVGDHQMGNDDEYSWWLTQKSNDLYYMPQRFVPMYGYERSVWYPNGHRNIVWAERGYPVLKIGPAEAKGQANSGPILYPYLRETKGIATSHSSATDQGTDWRDNDPALEPLVEIYQGFESNYEHAGAPRAWKEGEKTVHQGLKPLGYVWNAWSKGLKLGVQSSSDHISTHSSYACILTEDYTRQGLMDALRKRHAYAATDSIVMDYRIVIPEGTYLMGDITSTSGQPRLVVKVLGTAPIKEIHVIKNNTYVHKVSPGTKDASFEYVDRSFGPGENYYYVRAEQADGQLAWSSPIWVKSK